MVGKMMTITDLNGSEFFVPARKAAFRRIGEEVVIVDTGKNKMMTLNETGSEIWSLFEKKSLHDIACHLTTKFQTDLSQAKKDVFEFVLDLYARGLLDVDQRAE